LFEVVVGARGVRCHRADQVSEGGDHIWWQGVENVAVAKIAVYGDASNNKFCLGLMEPAYRVLLPKSGEDEAVRGCKGRAVGL
jgi:hypothetical protein